MKSLQQRKWWRVLSWRCKYPENLHDLHNDFSFLPERMKIEKVEKLVANLHNKKEYVKHVRNLKQSLNYGLVLKKVLSVNKIFFQIFFSFYTKILLAIEIKKAQILMNTTLYLINWNSNTEKNQNYVTWIQTAL